MCKGMKKKKKNWVWTKPMCTYAWAFSSHQMLHFLLLAFFPF